MRKLIFTITLFCLFCEIAESKNLYVNNSGSPACSDSTTYAANNASNPWCTIGRAAWGNASRSSPTTSQAAQAGDVVLVTAGTYTVAAPSPDNQGVTYNPVNSGTSGNPIIFRAVGTVDLRYSSGYGAMIGATSLSGPGSVSPNYITWDGFTIYDQYAPMWTNSGDSSIGNARCGYVIGCTIQNCYFYGNLSTGAGSNYAAIWLAGNGSGGSGGSSYLIKNNTIRDYLNFGTGYHHNAPGVMFYGVWDSVVENNRITNCGAGVHVKGYHNENNTIRFNYFDTVGEGWLFGVTHGTHKGYQNIVINSNSGFKFQQDTSTSFNGTYYIVNNTFINCGNNNDEVGTIWTNAWLASIPEITNVYIRNNIIYRSTGSTMVGQSWWIWGAWDRTWLDYNNYYQVTRYKKSATNYSTLANWQTALGGCAGTGRECSSITTDPQLVSGSYKLQGGSPALTLGRTINAIHGSNDETIPAGAYITGNEVIGVDSGESDTTAPSVSITTGNSTITINSLTVTGTASDAVGVSSCKYRLGSAPDGSNGTACSGTTSWTCSGTTGYASGANTLYVGCSDAAGNWGSDSITVNYSPASFSGSIGGGLAIY